MKAPMSREYIFWRAGTIGEHAEDLRADKYCPRVLAGWKYQTYLLSERKETRKLQTDQSNPNYEEIFRNKLFNNHSIKV